MPKQPVDADSWQPRDAEIDGPPRTEPPEIDADEPRVADTLFAGVRLAVVAELDGLEIVNVAFDECDLAGLICRNGRTERLRVSGGRLRGITWVRGLFRDVTVTDVSAAEISLRFSTLRHVLFRDCALPGLDLTETVFERVRFERCDLRGAVFDHAKVTDLRITGCNLAGATGAEALRGAVIDVDDIASLALSLATAVGITPTEG